MNRMNMKRLSLVFAVLLLAFTQHVHAQYYSVNYDARTVAAMAAAFGTEVVAESYYREQVDDILKHYTAAEVAAAGIFSSKFLEQSTLGPRYLVQQHGKLLLPPHLPHGGRQDHTENLGGGKADASLTADSDPLGQLSDEGVR